MTTILMVDPAYYDVAYVINPHMTGNIGKVEQGKARLQWEAIRQTYEQLGFSVCVLPAQPGFPDLVFAANQSFPFVDATGRKKVILSRMATKERAGEVAFFEAWYREHGFEILPPPGNAPFEGMGDLLWHPNPSRYQVPTGMWGGYGFRTDAKVYNKIEQITGVPIFRLQLVDENFYHLDTCLAPISETSAVYYPPAFTSEGRELLKTHFPDLIEAPKGEARQGFACNGHSPDGKHFLLQPGSDEVCKELKKRRITPIELDTSEFLKSGGSVFCLKMMV